MTLFVRLEGPYLAFNGEMAIHCLMEALRITSDIRYTELKHSVTNNANNECKILLYESELSGLLLYLHTDEVLATAKTVYAQFLAKIKAEEAIVDEVYPIPTCQYQKKLKDLHLIHQVESVLDNICILINEMKENFVNINNYN